MAALSTSQHSQPPSLKDQSVDGPRSRRQSHSNHLGAVAEHENEGEEDVQYYFEGYGHQRRLFPDTVKQFFSDESPSGEEEKGVKLIQQYFIMGRIPWLTESWDFRGQKRIYKFFGLDPFWPMVLFSFGTLWSNFLLALLVCGFFGCVILYALKRDRLPLLLDSESDSNSSFSDDDDKDYTELIDVRRYGSGSHVFTHGSRESRSSGKLQFSSEDNDNETSGAVLEEEMMELFAF